MFRIKICGVTSPLDAETACGAGADAVGINFFPGSVRYVPADRAAPILEAIRGKAVPVGVFVNERPETIRAVCRSLGIEVVQLSGKETAEDAARISFRLLKAVHWGGSGGLASFRGYPCEAFLLDAAVPGAYGGTGEPLDWESLGKECGGPRIRFGEEESGKRWLLAGGLTPENVERAIRLARPYGVDVAGGVEEAPGKKDPGKVRRFVENARRGFGSEGTQP